MSIRAPWWMCFGWSPRSALCVLDTLGHIAARYVVPARYSMRALVLIDPICERHDRHVIGASEEV